MSAARTRARVHVADRSLAEEGGAAARRLHRDRRLRRGRGHHRQPLGETRAADVQRLLDRHQHIEHRLLPSLRLAARLDRLDRAANAVATSAMPGSARASLPSVMNKRAVERAGRAADLHHQRHPDGLQRFRQRLGSERPRVCQHGLEAALHVEAVIAVADRLIERGQLVGCVDHCVRDRLDQLRRQALRDQASASATRLPGSIEDIAASVNAIATASPGDSPASGSASVTKSCSPIRICTWFWSPRCSTQVTRPVRRPLRALCECATCSVRTPIVSRGGRCRNVGQQLGRHQIDARAAEAGGDVELIGLS